MISCWVGSLCWGKCPCCSVLVFQIFLFVLVCFILIEIYELPKKELLMPSSLYVCGCNNISRSTWTLMVDGCITCIYCLTLLFLNMFDGKNYYMRRFHETYVSVTCRFCTRGTYKIIKILVSCDHLIQYLEHSYLLSWNYSILPP